MRMNLKRIDNDDLGMIMMLELPENIRKENNVVNIKSKIDRGDSIIYDLDAFDDDNIFSTLTLDQISKFVDFYCIDEEIDGLIKERLNQILKLKDEFLKYYPNTMFDIEINKGAIRKDSKGRTVFFNLFKNIQNNI